MHAPLSAQSVGEMHGQNYKLHILRTFIFAYLYTCYHVSTRRELYFVTLLLLS